MASSRRARYSARTGTIVKPPAPKPWQRSLLGAIDRTRDLFSGSTRYEMAVLFRSLAELIESGVLISNAVAVIRPSLESVPMKLALHQVEMSVSRGLTPSQAFSLCPDVFPEIVVRMSEVGERSGSFPEMLRRLAEYFEQQVSIFLKVRSALTYPLLVLVLCGAIVILLPGFLLDGVFRMLRDLDAEIPMSTRALMTLSDLVRDPFAWLVGAGAVVAAALVYRRRMRNREIRRKRDAWLLRLRGVGPCLRHIALLRFTAALEVMMSTGTPILVALTVAGKAAQNLVFEDAAEQVGQALKAGIPLHVSLGRTHIMPRIHTQLVAMGEESGSMTEMLKQCAWLSELEIEQRIGAALAALEPAVMMFMGAVVGFICLATLSPMLQALQKMAL